MHEVGAGGLVQTEVKKECPSCGLGVHLEATVCEFCGWDFEEEDEWILQIEKLERELLLEKQKYAPGSIEAAVLGTLRPPTLERVEPTPAPSTETPEPAPSKTREKPEVFREVPSVPEEPARSPEPQRAAHPVFERPPRFEPPAPPARPAPTPVKKAPARRPSPPPAPSKPRPAEAPKAGGGLKGLFSWPGGSAAPPGNREAVSQRRLVRRVRPKGAPSGREASVAKMRAEAEAEASAAQDLIRGGGPGTRPPVEVFLCPVCHNVVPAEALQCPSCGAEFAESG